MKITKEYEWNEVVWDALDIGDSIQLPEFTVPEATIDGCGELHFKRQTVKDTATVYSTKGSKIYFVFDHVLFKSAMDLNNAAEWKKTQLHDYLKNHFKSSMKEAGIPVSKVSLLSKDKVFGEKALPFFKDGRNRVAFTKDELQSEWYWLKDLASAASFCIADSNGHSGYNSASYAGSFVRPCFSVDLHNC